MIVIKGHSRRPVDVAEAKLTVQSALKRYNYRPGENNASVIKLDERRLISPLGASFLLPCSYELDHFSPFSRRYFLGDSREDRSMISAFGESMQGEEVFDFVLN